MWTSLFRMLPASWRRTIAISSIRPDARMSAIAVGISAEEEDAIDAARLIHDAYVRRGILAPHPTRLHACVHSASPHAWTLIAREGARAVGTVSFVDAPTALPMEKIYGPEVRAIRAHGTRIAEVGGFAIAPEYRKSGLAVLLMWSLFLTTRALGVEKMVIAVHPKAEPIYRDGLLFRRIGGERSYPGLTADARAIALASPPLDEVDAHYRAMLERLAGGTAMPAIRGLDGLEPAMKRLGARKAILRARPDLVAPRASLISIHEGVAA
jgi:hypothetical protein